MRNRTEMVSNTGSEYDENEGEFEADDGSDDWKPDPEDSGKKAKRTSGKRKATATKTSAKSKKSKKEESEEDEEEGSEDEDGEGEGEDNEEFDEDEEEDESMDASKSSAKKTKKAPSEADARNFPDRQGIFSLYAYKGDLKNGLRANSNICLWRRDGQSLLQKYMRDKDSKNNAIFFNSSMVYSCWEDRRREEFLEVKVKCVANAGKDATRDSKVELLDIGSIEQTCIDGKYHDLDLEPYVSYADKKKEEDALNGTSTSQAQDEDEEEEVSEGEE